MVYDEMGKTAKQFDLSVEETKSYLKEACAILYKARSSRPRPHLDDKIITAWNGKLLRTALFLLYTVFFYNRHVNNEFAFRPHDKWLSARWRGVG